MQVTIDKSRKKCIKVACDDGRRGSVCLDERTWEMVKDIIDMALTKGKEGYYAICE